MAPKRVNFDGLFAGVALQVAPVKSVLSNKESLVFRGSAIRVRKERERDRESVRVRVCLGALKCG